MPSGPLLEYVVLQRPAPGLSISRSAPFQTPDTMTCQTDHNLDHLVPTNASGEHDATHLVGEETQEDPGQHFYPRANGQSTAVPPRHCSE